LESGWGWMDEKNQAKGLLSRFLKNILGWWMAI
jgi:hypothetical protein